MPTSSAPESSARPARAEADLRLSCERTERGVRDDEDRAWITACAAGSLPALESLFNSHGPPCLRLASSIAHEAQLAEDAVHEAFLDAWRGAAAFAATGSAVAPWLLRLTQRRSVEHLRRVRSDARLVERVPELLDDLGLAQACAKRQLSESTHALLRALPGAQRQCFVLAYWGGYTLSQISVLTGTPTATVRRRCLAGLRGLREFVGDGAESERSPLSAPAGLLGSTAAEPLGAAVKGVVA